MTSVSNSTGNFSRSTIILSKDNKYSNLNIKTSGISMWFERWFLSSNAKDIGVLYPIYALFSGLIGTAFSVLIRLELFGSGVYAIVIFFFYFLLQSYIRYISSINYLILVLYYFIYTY